MKKVLLFCLFLLAGCSTHLSDITVISNKNIELDKINLDKLPQKKWAVGTDTKFVFLFIPFGNPQIKEALNDALGDGDLMLDATLRHKYWFFPFGFTQLEIEGNVVKTREAK